MWALICGYAGLWALGIWALGIWALGMWALLGGQVGTRMWVRGYFEEMQKYSKGGVRGGEGRQEGDEQRPTAWDSTSHVRILDDKTTTIKRPF
jgi:hypothetical protein